SSTGGGVSSSAWSQPSRSPPQAARWASTDATAPDGRPVESAQRHPQKQGVDRLNEGGNHGIVELPAGPDQVLVLYRPAEARRASSSTSTSSDGSMSPATRTRVDAGRIVANSSPLTAATVAGSTPGTMYIRVRTTSAALKPASSSAATPIANAARAWAAASAGWRDRPSGPASVVPATQHESPTATARL